MLRYTDLEITMIYTVTFNPAIDYVVHMGKELAPGMTNRTDGEECYFGGKGINVSSVLKNLGHDSCALGFVAGFTGEAIARSVEERGIKDSLILVDQLAFIVNVPNHTVVTAMDQTENKNNVFTNIDGAVIA